MSRIKTVCRVACGFVVLLTVSACSSSDDEAVVTKGAGQTQLPSIRRPAAPVQPVQQQPTGTEEEFRRMAGFRINFGYDSHSLNPEARQTLTRQATWLKQNPQVKIVVEGHCDDRGTDSYNFGLGLRRANTVKQFLLSQGVPVSRIERPRTYGELCPLIVGNHNANRRAETRFYTSAVEHQSQRCPVYR